MARRLALVAGLIGLLLLALLLLVPFGGKERRFFGTVPRPDPVSAITLVPLKRPGGLLRRGRDRPAQRGRAVPRRHLRQTVASRWS